MVQTEKPESPFCRIAYIAERMHLSVESARAIAFEGREGFPAPLKDGSKLKRFRRHEVDTWLTARGM